MPGQEFRLQKIGVVMLGVKSLARSVPFYRDKLGLAVVSEIPGFAFLSGGGVTLALSEPLARNSSQMVGATEVVFSVDDVASAFRALREAGVEFTQEPRVVTGTMWAANFTDPDGHRLSIFGPKGVA